MILVIWTDGGERELIDCSKKEFDDKVREVWEIEGKIDYEDLCLEVFDLDNMKRAKLEDISV